MHNKSYSSMKIAISKSKIGSKRCNLLYVTKQLQQNKVQKHLCFSQNSFHKVSHQHYSKAFYPVKRRRRQESFVSFSRGTPTPVEMFSVTAITKKSIKHYNETLKLGNCKVQFALAAQLKKPSQTQQVVFGFIW